MLLTFWILKFAEGPFGGWSEWTFSRSNRSIVSVNIRSQPPCELYSGYCDNSATNGLRFVDSSGVHYEPWDEYWYLREVEHSFQKWKEVDYKLKGYWSSATCPGGSTNANGLGFPGKVITGFRTKVEPHRGDGDDTGLNMVQFHCGFNVWYLITIITQTGWPYFGVKLQLCLLYVCLKKEK